MLGEETKSRTEQVRTLGTEKLMITKSRQLKKKGKRKRIHSELLIKKHSQRQEEKQA